MGFQIIFINSYSESLMLKFFVCIDYYFKIDF